MFTAGQSDAGRELAAKHADCIFAVAMSKAAGVAFMQDVKGRLAKYGRAPSSLKIFCTTTFYVGRTSEEADDLFQQIGDLILPSLGVDYLEEMLKISLKDYDIDGPVPDIDPTEANGLNTERVGFAKLIKDNNLTIRQAYQRIAASAHAPIMKGSPMQIADQMEDWYRSGACDGFMVATPYSPKVFNDFVDLVVPELQRRRALPDGIHRTHFPGEPRLGDTDQPVLLERAGLRRRRSAKTAAGRWPLTAAMQNVKLRRSDHVEIDGDADPHRNGHRRVASSGRLARQRGDGLRPDRLHRQDG